MNLNINHTEQDILHEALIQYLEKTLKARDQLISAGGILQHDPVLSIKQLHSKIISLTEEE